jgi:hypothetical protein
MASTYLSWTPSGAGSTTKWTTSFWVKRGTLGSTQELVANWSSGTDNTTVRFLSGDTLDIVDYQSSSVVMKRVTNRVFRDTNAWYHIVVNIDTTQATANDRTKLYVNGVQETSFSTTTNYSLNADQKWNTTYVHNIGQSGAPAGYFDGSMAHVHMADGTAYDASTFGETDATTGIWKPKTAPSVTYGTNGFFLKFENSGAFGTDSSGNGNNFTVNGTMTQTIDTPSNVFATYNPLGNTFPADTFSNGNTTQTTSVANYSYNTSTLGASSGKYYCEIKNVNNNNNTIGIVDRPSTSATDELTGTTYGWGYYNNGQVYNNGSVAATYSSQSAGDIIGIAMDLDNNKLYFSKNGTWQGSSDPSAGTGGISITDPESNRSGFYFFASGNAAPSTSGINQANFGNGYFGTTAVSSAQNPDDGIGIFEFSPPTGYKALCTKSINAQEYS